LVVGHSRAAKYIWCSTPTGIRNLCSSICADYLLVRKISHIQHIVAGPLMLLLLLISTITLIISDNSSGRIPPFAARRVSLIQGALHWSMAKSGSSLDRCVRISPGSVLLCSTRESGLVLPSDLLGSRWACLPRILVGTILPWTGKFVHNASKYPHPRK